MIERGLEAVPRTAAMKTPASIVRQCSLGVGLAVLAFGAAARAEPPAGPAPSTTAPAPAAPGPSAPGGTDATVDQAREAFTLGTALANQGEWPEALNAFQRSAALHPHPVTTYNIAYCERSLGHYTRAYKLFERALAEHTAGTTGTLPDDLLALAKGYYPEMEHRLAHVSVRAELGGGTLSVDGRPLELVSTAGGARQVLIAGTRDDRGSEAPPAASFELWIDPGRHVFVVSRPGAADKVTTESFDAATSKELVLGVEPPPAAPKPSEKATLDLHTAEAGPDRTWMWVAYGAGAAGLVTGSVFGILAMTKSSSLSTECPQNKICVEGTPGADHLSAANTFSTVADIGFGVAIVGAGVGTYLLLSSGSSDEEKKRPRSASVEPLLGPTFVGARGRF